MAEEKRFTKATWQIMEQLLEVDNLDDALSGSLEIIVKTLNSEAGAITPSDTSRAMSLAVRASQVSDRATQSPKEHIRSVPRARA